MFSPFVLQSFISAPNLADDCKIQDSQSPPPGCTRREVIPQSPEEAIAQLNDIYQRLLIVQEAGFIERGSQIDIALTDAQTSVVKASDNVDNPDFTQV